MWLRFLFWGNCIRRYILLPLDGRWNWISWLFTSRAATWSSCAYRSACSWEGFYLSCLLLSLRFENACSCCSWEDVCLINLPYLPSNFYQSRRDVVKWCFIQSFSFSCILHHFNFCWSQVGLLSFGKLIFYVLKNFSHLWIFIFFVWEFCYFSALLYEFYCLNSYPRDW